MSAVLPILDRPNAAGYACDRSIAITFAARLREPTTGPAVHEPGTVATRAFCNMKMQRQRDQSPVGA